MSTPELSGSWIYRSFNPTYVTGGDPEREHELILADADLNVEHRTSPTTLEGTIEWRTGPRPEEKGGLDLKGTVLEGELRGLEIVGTGRPRTDTAGWEYRYHGHLLPSGAGLLATVVDRPILGGSVFRAKSHNGNPPRSEAGSVYPFIAVWKQPLLEPPAQPFLTSEFAGLWTYRSFRNDRPTPVYKSAPQHANELTLQEGVFKLETPTNWWTLQGAIEWEGRLLDLRGAIRLWDPPPTGEGGEPVSFQIVGTGRPGTDTAGWEYYYHGYLTRHWAEGKNQRPALVGSVMRAKPHGEATPAVAPFIALKQ
jgi:hypothetical protein